MAPNGAAGVAAPMFYGPAAGLAAPAEGSVPPAKGSLDGTCMRSLLARIGLPKAVGLYLDEAAVHLSEVVATPWGPVEVARGSEDLGPDPLPAAIPRLLTPFVGRRGLGRVPVAVGLPAGRVYFSTRPIQTPGSDVSPHVLLREALRSTNVSIDEMVVDVVKAQPDKRPVASIASCNRKYLAGLLDAGRQCGLRFHRAEPAPCALLRAAATRRSEIKMPRRTGWHRPGRSPKVMLRLFLSDTQALAVLVANNLPLVWRYVRLPRGDEASALLSVSRSLGTMRRLCGVESPLEAVTLHGRPDLTRLLDVDWMQEQLGVPVKWFEGPPLDASQVAFGLALGCLREPENAFDLARSLKRPASLWELFPAREAILQAAALVCMALLLAGRSAGVHRSYTAARAQNAQHPWAASIDTAQLERERRQLRQEVASVHRFLDGRVSWTSYARDLAACLPPSAFLTSFQGVSELPSGRKRRSAKAGKSLVLRGAASIPKDGSMPHEIDRFLETLREHPMLQRDFPLVELAELKQSRGAGQGDPIVLFTVVCLPKKGKGGAR